MMYADTRDVWFAAWGRKRMKIWKANPNLDGRAAASTSR
jgi:hypothetical protein